MTDTQTHSELSKGKKNSGLYSKTIPEDVAKKRNFLSKNMRALLPGVYHVGGPVPEHVWGALRIMKIPNFEFELFKASNSVA